MGERKNPFRNIKLVFRPASPALKIVVIILIVCSMAALIALTWVRTSILNRTEDLREEAAGLEYENAELEDKIADYGSVDSIMDIAQEELGLVDPNTVIIDPNS